MHVVVPQGREQAEQTDPTVGRLVGKGARAGVERLALTHLSSRYAGGWERLEREAREAFDGECFVASDGQTVDVPYPE